MFKTVTFIFLIVSGILSCTPESLNFDSTLLGGARSTPQRKMDRYIPINVGADYAVETTYHNLKIFADTSTISSLESTNPTMYKFLIKQLIPACTNHMENTFSVRETQSNSVQVAKCSDASIPENLKTNIPYDLILLFTIEGTASDSFVAWASPCQLHSESQRPVVGRVNMNPNHLSYEKKKFFDQFSTVLHEIYHIMGFSKNLYKYFVDSTLTRKDESDTYVVNSSQTLPYQLKSPLLLAHGRDYFNCNTLTGVPVEDGGGSGSAGSHWEKIVLGNEVMVANQVANPVVSKFTLKLLEDSGWYQINYNMAEGLMWNKNNGCSVNTGTCNQYGHSCTSTGDEGCFYDYTFQAVCTTDTFSNSCNFYTGTDFNAHDCRITSNVNSYSSDLGEVFGANSRCFEGSMDVNGINHGNMCYQATCTGTSSIQLTVGGTSYNCNTSGQVLTVTGKGTITCPDIAKFCEHKNSSCPDDCNSNGRCQKDKSCFCYPSYSDASCKTSDGSYIWSEPTCTNNCTGNGSCVNGVCSCNKGWTGSTCNTVDVFSFFNKELYQISGILLLIIYWLL